jgi:hypothetical protein
MDLALDYLARTTHERNVAAADRINAYRRRVAERRALEAEARAGTSPATDVARAARSFSPSRWGGHHTALPGRP